MKKLVTLLAVVTLMMIAGTALALPLPTEWGVISPTSLSSAPSYTPSTDFGYYIWTDDSERTSWHIRWMDGTTSGTTYFNGTIALQNNAGVFTTFSFESGDTNISSPIGDTYISQIVQGTDGIDFTISQTSTPSYVGFDLFYGFEGMDANYIFIGGNEQTVASLGEDQDFAIAAPVPEPGTIVLLGAGLLGLGIYGRRRSKK